MGYGGCFRQYLHHFGLDDSSNCPEVCRACDISLPRFAIERRNLNQRLSKRMTPENIVAEMVRSKKNWLTLFSAIVKIQKDLLKEEKKGKEESHRSTNA